METLQTFAILLGLMMGVVSLIFFITLFFIYNNTKKDNPENKISMFHLSIACFCAAATSIMVGQFFQYLYVVLPRLLQK